MQAQLTPSQKLARPDYQKGKEEGVAMASLRQRQCGVLRRGGWMEVTTISRGVEISIARGVAETEHDSN